MTQQDEGSLRSQASGGVVELPENWTTQLGWLFDVANYETYSKVVRLVQMWQGNRDGTADEERPVSESAPATPEPVERAREIGRKLANEEPTAGAGRVTNRYLHALVTEGLIAAASGVDLPEVEVASAVCGQVHGGEVCSLRRVHDTNGCWVHYGPEVDPDAQFACAVDRHIAGQVPCPHCVPIAGRPQPDPPPEATSAASQDGFFEEDESVEDVKAAFDSGLKFTTAPPTYAAPVRIGSASTPPAAGEADTTPRVWRDRTGDLWKELAEPRRVAVLVQWEGRPYDGVPVLMSDIRSAHGPLVEVLPNTEQPPSPSQGGGTDG